VFNYPAFRYARRYSAYDLAESLGVNVCPYCNRGFTFTVAFEENNIIRPEFDHYFSQVSYPYLALAFYNLIPSCHICNSNLKGKEDFSIDRYIHPYLDGIDDYLKFTISLRDQDHDEVKDVFSAVNQFGIDFFYGALDAYTLKFKLVEGRTFSGYKRAIRTCKTFKLNDLYNRHKDMVSEIIQSSMVYNDDWIQSQLNIWEGTLFRNREDVLRLITRNYVNPDDLSKRTFSKLTNDISNELGLQ
jgi:hypothetical protein